MKILILEDDYSCYEAVYRVLEQRLPTAIIFPNKDNWKSLKDNMLMDKYDIVAANPLYMDVDIYVVDIYFPDAENKRGFDFLRHIESIRKDDYEYIFMSANDIEGYDLQKYNENELMFVPKGSFKNNNEVGESVAAKIESLLLKKGELIYTDEVKKLKEPESGLIQFKKPSMSIKMVQFYRNIPKYLDEIILSMLHLLIFISVLYALIATILEIGSYILSAFNHEDGLESKILKIVENILLYILPMLFLLGLYRFYDRTIKNYLVRTVNPETPHQSIKTFNVTKLIFLSSVLSYVIIKTIDEVFWKEQKDIVLLISYGILVLILMIFILVQHILDDKMSSKK